mgnify:CR=1 FL=1
MKISLEFNINKVILITSPRAGEEGIARRLEENIADVSNGGGIHGQLAVSVDLSLNYHPKN